MRLLIRLVVVLISGLGTAFAGTTTVDFADSTGTVNSFTSRGYDFNTSYAYILQNSPGYEFWNLNTPFSYTMTETGNQPFDLEQMYVLLTTGGGPSTADATISFTGNLQGGGTVTHQIVLHSIVYSDNTTVLDDETVVFDNTWVNLTSVVADVEVTNNGLSSTFFDDIVVTSPPAQAIAAAVDIQGTYLHPRHDGRDPNPSTPGGKNPDDGIPVVVFGSSTSVGDPEDLDTDLIDPATLVFGPGMGGISPIHGIEFNLDEDSDGLDDARFRFLMSDAAFDSVTCTDSSGTLTGELTTGESFEGSDTFISNCNAACHP